MDEIVNLILKVKLSRGGTGKSWPGEGQVPGGLSTLVSVRSDKVWWVQGAGCKVQGAGCKVQGAGCRVQGAGCRVQGAGCRVQGAGAVDSR